jgi:hypothetical protein
MVDELDVFALLKTNWVLCMLYAILLLIPLNTASYSVITQNLSRLSNRCLYNSKQKMKASISYFLGYI